MNIKETEKLLEEVKKELKKEDGDITKLKITSGTQPRRSDENY